MQPRYVHIAVTFTDATLGVVAFITAEMKLDGSPRWEREASATNIVADLRKMYHARHPKQVASWRRIETSELPATREFRDAWRDGGGAITVHMPAAREIYKDRLRLARAPRLAALDEAYMRADERADAPAKAAIAAEKQALRDVTAHPSIDAAQAPEDFLKVDALLAAL